MWIKQSALTDGSLTLARLLWVERGGRHMFWWYCIYPRNCWLKKHTTQTRACRRATTIPLKETLRIPSERPASPCFTRSPHAFSQRLSLSCLGGRAEQPRLKKKGFPTCQPANSNCAASALTPFTQQQYTHHASLLMLPRCAGSTTLRAQLCTAAQSA